MGIVSVPTSVAKEQALSSKLTHHILSTFYQNSPSTACAFVTTPETLAGDKKKDFHGRPNWSVWPFSLSIFILWNTMNPVWAHSDRIHEDRTNSVIPSVFLFVARLKMPILVHLPRQKVLQVVLKVGLLALDCCGLIGPDITTCNDKMLPPKQMYVT